MDNLIIYIVDGSKLNITAELHLPNEKGTVFSYLGRTRNYTLFNIITQV
jgi:hypothetical protein